MASVPGGQYTFFANGENVNVVTTSNGNNLSSPVAGEFNLEVLTGSGPSAIPAGYQGVAMLLNDGTIVDLANGDYGVRVTGGGHDTIMAGSGNDTIYGGSG